VFTSAREHCIYTPDLEVFATCERISSTAHYIKQFSYFLADDDRGKIEDLGRPSAFWVQFRDFDTNSMFSPIKKIFTYIQKNASGSNMFSPSGNTTAGQREEAPSLSAHDGLSGALVCSMTPSTSPVNLIQYVDTYVYPTICIKGRHHQPSLKKQRKKKRPQMVINKSHWNRKQYALQKLSTV